MAQDDLSSFRSASQLSSYTRCGLAYKLERIDRVPSPPAAWTVRGNAVHKTIEEWENQDREPDPAKLYEVVWHTEYRNTLGEYPDLSTWLKTPRVTSTERDLKLRQADGLKQVLGYCQRALKERHLWMPLKLSDGKLAVELPFKVKIPDIFLTGYIDLVKYWNTSGILTVTDIKTGSDDSENFRQLGLYRYALKEAYGLDVAYGEYWYTKYDRSSGWIDLTRYTHQYLVDQYSQLDKSIKNGIFLPDPSKKKCQFCGVRPHCPEMRDR